MCMVCANDAPVASTPVKLKRPSSFTVDGYSPRTRSYGETSSLRWDDQLRDGWLCRALIPSLPT